MSKPSQTFRAYLSVYGSFLSKGPREEHWKQSLPGMTLSL